MAKIYIMRVLHLVVAWSLCSLHYHLLSKIIKLEVEVEELQKASQHVNTCFHLLVACLISFYLSFFNSFYLVIFLLLFLFISLSSTDCVHFYFIQLFLYFSLSSILTTYFTLTNSLCIFLFVQLFLISSISSFILMSFKHVFISQFSSRLCTRYLCFLFFQCFRSPVNFRFCLFICISFHSSLSFSVLLFSSLSSINCLSCI